MWFHKIQAWVITHDITLFPFPLPFHLFLSIPRALSLSFTPHIRIFNSIYVYVSFFSVAWFRFDGSIVPSDSWCSTLLHVFYNKAKMKTKHGKNNTPSTNIHSDFIFHRKWKNLHRLNICRIMMKFWIYCRIMVILRHRRNANWNNLI